MAIGNIVCSNCGKEYLWQHQLAGHSVRCTCGHVMPVPEAAPQTDSVYALAPSDDARPAARPARGNLEDSMFELPCPSCQQPIAFGGVICTHCGYNVKTGEQTRQRSLPPAAFVQLEVRSPAIAPVTVPQYAPPPTPVKHSQVGHQRKLLVGFLVVMACVLLLTAVATALRSRGRASPTTAEALSAADAAIAAKLTGVGAMEAREWLAVDEQRMIGRYNQRQAINKIEEIYRNGATQVTVPGGRFVMSVIVELPQALPERRRFFDWQKQHHESIGDTVETDSGQKYIYITMPR